MNLVYLAGFAWEPKGTVRARAFPLAEEMVRRGHQVTLLIMPYDNPRYSGEASMRNGVNIINLAVHGNPLADLVQLPRAAVAMIDQISPDLVHVFKPKGLAGMVAAKLIRQNRIPLVLDCDDWEGWGGWNEVKNYPWVMKEFIDYQERSLTKKSAVVTTASRVLFDRARTLRNADPVFYVPNGVSESQAALARQMLQVPAATLRRTLGFGDLPVVLYAGNFDGGDDVDLLASAITKAVRSSRFTLAIVGEGPCLADLRQKLDAIPELKIRYFGRLPYESYVQVLAASGIALFPYADIPVFRAKCSARIIDYMLFGKAILTTSVGQINQYLVHRESGFVTAPGDAKVYAEALIELLEDPTLCQRLGRSARERLLSQFAWSGSSADNCETAYQHALSLTPAVKPNSGTLVHSS